MASGFLVCRDAAIGIFMGIRNNPRCSTPVAHASGSDESSTQNVAAMKTVEDARQKLEHVQKDLISRAYRVTAEPDGA